MVLLEKYPNADQRQIVSLAEPDPIIKESNTSDLLLVVKLLGL
jgi:hypothetical protein